jgi:HK97 family phage prohead protease
MTGHSVERYLPLDDISIRSDGDGRTVDAYAAVFGVRQEIRDREGHYFEELAPGSFDRTVEQRKGSLQFIFNHGRTMHGTPSERFSMPLGTPEDVSVDGHGLRTVSRVAKTDLGDEVLELIRDGAIRGQSFGGAFVASEVVKAEERGGLPLRIRTEVALREYGPTPFPAYADARIVGVRSEAAEIIEHLSVDEIAGLLAPLSEEARADLVRHLVPALADPRTGTDGPPDTRHALVTLSRSERQKALRALALKELA